VTTFTQTDDVMSVQCRYVMRPSF